MFETLEPETIEVGKQYQVENKYYYCVLATIVEDECGENAEEKHSKDWVGWKIRVDESYGGMMPLKEGTTLSIGWDTKYSHYSTVAIKEVGSSPEYNGFTIS